MQICLFIYGHHLLQLAVGQHLGTLHLHLHRQSISIQRIAEAIPSQHQENRILKAKFILRAISKT